MDQTNNFSSLTRILLILGILAVFLNIIMDVLSVSLWKGYDFKTQSISVLSAIGSPVRKIALPLTIITQLLMIAFAIGIWIAAAKNPLIRVMAGLLVGCAFLSLIGHAIFPLRVGETTVNTLNLIPMATSVILFLAAMSIGATAFHNWFRYFTIALLLAYLLMTILGALVFPRLSAIPAKPTTGLQERTMLYSYLVWVLLLAIEMLKGKGS
jgi:hypothetical protein